eukprot:XP_020399682.1 chaperone protein dnaJ GFA2, mitochondrial [Zea mays]
MRMQNRSFKRFSELMRDRDFGSHDIKVALELSFMEAVQGCSKTINFQTSVTCETCNGAGVPPGTKPETCLACRGSGFMFMQTGPFRMQSTCTKCGGSGKTVKAQRSTAAALLAAKDDGASRCTTSGGTGDLLITAPFSEDQPNG